MNARLWLAPAVLLVSSAASAQEFAGMPGLAESLAAIRARAAATRAEPAGLRHVMGSDRGGPEVSADSLPPASAPGGTPDASAFGVRGADVSHFQGDIDWTLMRGNGLSFVYVKATEGAEDVDDKFAANWAGASRAGLRRGAYHFYNFCKGGAAQAAHFASVVRADAADLPMTVDLERSGDCRTMPSKKAFLKDLAAFTKKIEAVYGRRPILYLNYAIYDRYFAGERVDYKLWVADTGHPAPALSDGAAWTMWQYAWRGRLAGVPGDVDLDVFDGTPQMFASLSSGPSDVLVASLGPR